MAIDRTGISSLDAGALDITYSGDEGPKSPKQIAGGEYNRVLELLEKVREDIPLSEEEKMELQGLIRTLTAKGINVEQLMGGSGDMRMASADPILQDEYDKYVFELQEMRPEAVPMSIEEFKQQAISGMAEGGIARLGLQGGGPPGQPETGRHYGYGDPDRPHGGPGPKFDPAPPGEIGGPGYISPKDLRTLEIKADIDKRKKEKTTKEDIIDTKFRLFKKKPFIPLPGATFAKSIGSRAYWPGHRDLAIKNKSAYAWSISDAWGNWFDSLSKEEQGSTDMMNFLSYSGAVPKGKSYADYTLTKENGSAGLIMSGDLSHFYQLKNPKSINPETGKPFTDREWIDFRRELIADRGYETGGDDPEWKNQGFPSYEAWLRTPQTGIPSATAPAPAAMRTAAATPPKGWNPLYHIGGGATQEQIDYMENFLGMAPGQTYSAQGGRVPAAFGGIMDTATGRRRYGLGSLNPFKAIKKLFKSKAGKLGLMALLGMKGPKWLGDLGLPGVGKDTPWFGKEGVFKALGSSFMEHPFHWITGLSGLGYLTAEKDKKDPYGRDEELAKWEKRFAGLGDYATPWYSAQGGRIGLHGGGSPEEDLYLNFIARRNEEGEKYNPSRGEYERYINRPIMMGQAMPEGGLDEIRRRRAEQGPALFAIRDKHGNPINNAADGGRIGYQGGGYYEDEEEDDRVAALRALYGIRRGAQEGGLMDLGGMEKDYRQEGGFVPIGGEERADDVPARLSKNEFVFTADAVRAAGGGDIDAGAEIMENVMENLEEGGRISEESQGLEGARDMFATAQRLEGVL